MPQIKFAPISKETQIPGTNCTIQIGVIQNHERSWGVKLTQNGRIIAAKRIKKLIDVEIVGIIRDTIGKTIALDTFELGTTMSNLLRETYDIIKSKQKPAETQKPAPQPAPTPAPAPQPTVSQPSPQKQSPLDSTLADIRIPTPNTPASGQGDSFWSAYSSITTPEEPYIEPQPTTQQPSQTAPSITPFSAPQTPSSSNKLEDAFAILGVKCSNCGNEVDPDVERCPYCGQPL
ncbi:MAG: zinc-ribbon domain-containing protein [Candidatus Helarchaeota archaeon]|nr:zinc-ribbon domain-containing protein [Candidatus Helarchaeota archaeon]